MTNIRYPNITGRTEAEQIKQLGSHMRYLVDQLNWALNMRESQTGSTSNTQEKQSSPASGVTDAKTLGGKTVDELKASFIDSIYPVGSVYISLSQTSPKTLFGGTWEQIKDVFLLSAGDTYSAGSTGGEAKVSLTANQLPHIHGNLTIGSGSNPVISDLRGGSGVFSVSGEGVVNGSKTATSSAYKGYNVANLDFGNNEAHNNMPPYLAVYMWKRTA